MLTDSPLSRFSPGSLTPPVRRLVAVRVLRSFNQGYLNVVAPLYLLSLGVSAAGLGALFTASFLTGAVLTLLVGFAADRHGRKPFLIAFTVLIFAWGSLYAATVFLPALLLVSAVAGIDRGGGNVAGGQAGPFAPAESALLADLVPPEHRHEVFSLNAFLATAAAALGTLLSGLPVWLRGLHVAFLGSDRVLFAGTALIGLISLVVLWDLPEPPRRPVERKEGQVLTPRATYVVVRQSIAAACQALGVGLVSSMVVVWFHLRFGVGAEAIGPMLTASYLLSAISFFPATAVARRIGSVRAIVVTRVIAAGMVLLMALSPTFFVAAVFQVARQVFSQMITPVRQSFTMGLVSSEERASVSGLTGLVRRLSAAASPSVSGVLMNAGDLALPLVGSAGLQLVSAALYFRFFDRMDDRPGSAAVPASAPARRSPVSTEERR